MVSILSSAHIVFKLTFFRNQIINSLVRTMAWRSVGKDNADLVNQLEGIFIILF